MVPRDGQTVSKTNTEIALSRTCSVCVLPSLQPSVPPFCAADSPQ